MEFSCQNTNSCILMLCLTYKIFVFNLIFPFPIKTSAQFNCKNVKNIAF